MTTPDLLYVTLIVIAILLDYLVMWPSFLRRSQDNPGPARRWLWSVWIITLWTLVALGALSWQQGGRTWDAVGFSPVHGWRLLLSIALVGLLVALYLRMASRIRSLPLERRVQLRDRFGELAAVVPHIGSELPLFVGASLTAGFTEEVIFRGYLLQAFQPVAGLWGAAGLSLVLFALGHAYQGGKGLVRSGAAGAVLTAVVLASGSLYPAIALHALVDIGQGVVAWLVFRDGPGGTEGTVATELAESA